MPHDGAATKMSLDVDVVRRHQVDDVLVRLAFAAGVSHGYIIVKSADDVNNYKLAIGRSNAILVPPDLLFRRRGLGDLLNQAPGKQPASYP